MVYSSDDEYGKHRGYDDFADFKNNETIPSDSGLEQIRSEANAIVNIAYWEKEEDSEDFTSILKQYEMRVMDRMIMKDHWMEGRKDPSPIPFLTIDEFVMLRELGDDEDTVMSISTKNKDLNNFSYGERGFWY
jgi:hypothetical protein